MSDVRVPVEGLEQTIHDALKDYSEDIIEGTKEAVKKSAKTVRKETSANAPRRRGKYAKSRRTKTTKENAHQLEVTVYSTIPGLPHLLENGHANRGGGRTAGQPHIAPAEQHGIEQLEQEIKKAIQKS